MSVLNEKRYKKTTKIQQDGVVGETLVSLRRRFWLKLDCFLKELKDIWIMNFNLF